MNKSKKILCLMLLITLYSCDGNSKRIEKKYGERGNLEIEVELINEKPDGLAKWYYPNGEIWKTANYRDGILHGKSLIYNKNGTIKTQQNYKDGKLDGKRLLFTEDGVKMGEMVWNNGRKISGITFKRNGDTLSVGDSTKITTYYSTRKIAEIYCKAGNGTLRFDENNQIVESKTKGSLPCLSQRDTILLDAQNPEWRKYF